MTDQDEDSWMQSTPPSPSVELSADRQWSPNNIAVQDSPLAMSRPPPTCEKAAVAVKSNVEHLTPRLRACLMCQIQKKKCDYGYPGQTKDDTRPHSKNLPCTREYSATSSRSPKALTACKTDGRETKGWRSLGAVLFLSEALREGKQWMRKMWVTARATVDK
jgi:hypothetical protein